MATLSLWFTILVIFGQIAEIEVTALLGAM